MTMIDRVKVIKGLEEAVRVIENHVPERYRCYSRLSCYDAIALLREQEEPVEPRWTHPEVGTNVLMCGCCGVAILLGKPNYCPWCGRKVKWDATT